MFLQLWMIRVLCTTLVTVLSLKKASSCEGNCFACGPRDCRDIQTLGFTHSGVYHVYPDRMFTGYDVFCDLEEAGGGWLVFQRRNDGNVDFYRGWDDYEKGFGDLLGEHWLGNFALHAITSQALYELRIELSDWVGNQTYAQYRYFKVTAPEDTYRLYVSGYSGEAGDSLYLHNGMVFSTHDREVNKYHKTGEDCASTTRGAWWFHNCGHSHLNGQYVDNSQSVANWTNATFWFHWKNDFYSVKTTEMKIRRV